MSLALNFYFWADWLGTGTTTTTTEEGHDSGGGKQKRIKPPRLSLDDVRQLEQDFWDQREEYLRRVLREVEPLPVISEPDERQQIEEALARFNEERSALILQMRSAPDIATMMAGGERLNQLNSEITRLLGKKAVAAFKQTA